MAGGGRCAVDAVLEEAGVLRHFVDHLDQATAAPDPAVLPQPADNRPYAIA